MGGSAKTPVKEQRLSEQRFIQENMAEQPAISHSKLRVYHPYCKLCRLDFSVCHGGGEGGGLTLTNMYGITKQKS